MLKQRDTKQVFWMKGGKEKNAGSGNHFLAGVYIQSWCCSLDGVQTQAGVMGIRTPWPDTPGTELVTDEDLMLFFPAFLFFSPYFPFFEQKVHFPATAHFRPSLSVQYRMDRRRFNANH